MAVIAAQIIRSSVTEITDIILSENVTTTDSVEDDVVGNLSAVGGQPPYEITLVSVEILEG